jgi:hypothetical protein
MSRQATLIQNSYANIESGGDRSLNTQAIITSFNKILDPSSVVRESEYDRTAEGQSLINRLQGKYDNIIKGGAGVSLATLKEAKEIADQYIKGAKKSIDAQNQRAQSMAKEFGLNEDFVTSTSSNYQEGTDYAQKWDTLGTGIDYENAVSQYGEDGVRKMMEASGISFSEPLSTGLNGSITKVAEAIGQYESGGNYRAIGKDTGGGNRAYGKYQVMASNIPSWTKEALGYSMTPQEFLNNPKAQDKVAQYKMNQYLQKYGSVENVATAWFAGPGAIGKNSQAKDVMGTSVPQYIKNVVSIYNKLT